MLKPWELLEEEIVFKNDYAIIVKRLYKLPNGKKGEYFIRDGIGDGASIIALNKEKKFVLAREFRPGPGVVLDELPGGVIDQGEEALEAAKRELLEETGYEGEFILLAKTYLSAYSTSKKYCYLALNCEKISGKNENKQEDEFIEVVLKDKVDFLKQVAEGELTDLETAILGLNYLHNHKLI